MNKRQRNIFRFTFLILTVFVLGLTACGGGSDPISADRGEEIFMGLCSACHGPEGTGILGLGKDLTTSEFVGEMSDSEFVDFIIEGRPATHEDNTTGVDMPPRGGNPDLSDDDLASIVAFVRTLQD